MCRPAVQVNYREKAVDMASYTSLLVLLSTVVCQALALVPFDTWSHARIQLQDTSIYFRYSPSGKPPLLLIHGFPQHSPTWATIGPILAEQYTVIAPDNRGSGESALAISDDYTAPAAAEDHLAILNFLNISSAYVVAHDKGAGVATALAFEHSKVVEKLVLIEYALPGGGYYTTCATSNQLYRDWQLAFFAVPDAAAYFIQGREKEMLTWYLYHGSYSGNAAISNDLLETYTRAISKPGFLRAGLQYFGAAFWEVGYWARTVEAKGKLQMPTLAMGGEASFGAVIREAWEGPYVEGLETDVIPKAGHWMGEENPVWTANRVLWFLGNASTVPSVDLSWLEDTITIFGNFEGATLTPGTNGTV
ncbi:Soluble epoxide hydrolase [Fulvia fulva]|uniref:Soluble epoxide hydrolase n=1 Tax=Passalora fulva TaxID=5499 RepID=A0A9Q8LCF6_PASFU|nr:Soluble epoxide hydrolase [Fulvia fulva]KAK4629204.1 Soluble epoxide hydrolase [Fulvia fulva]KAK4629790.1 Soluble epoxide hydrolase [Fulvia fulva]UJO14961.1 Soluble epoxide hydrolase [Fulvia fulva]WPV12853.1 Soluble epoxide hydrolase [Fulvia fulva]WPV27532.1 Soluble epoxide hydrolase [Fulvia fulva]